MKLFELSESLEIIHTRQDYPELLRRIRFKDPESGMVFITNNFSLPAATICALYKSRWQVELFFKWIKVSLEPSLGLPSRSSIRMVVLLIYNFHLLMENQKQKLFRGIIKSIRLLE